MAEATANPRTEIRLTRFPSSIARTGDHAGEIVPLALVFILMVTKDTGPWCCGRHTTAYLELCGAVRP
ncbi:hypothetical protein [Streptomyces tritici]|uniref:hypothetical protein n=1 Tax=Streptomyces tritici TaxID=2054410 RepID=UPI003AF193D7